MKQVARLIDAVADLMQLLSGVLIVAMMVTVLLDVTTRALFGLTDGGLDLTFIGGVELIKFGLLFTILFALPYCVDRSQVVVDLFTERLSERKKALLEGIYFLGYTLLGAAMTYRFYHAIGAAISSGETSQDLLIPMNYIYAITTFATALLAVRALLAANRRFCTAMGCNA
jgi:TRAP-type mannitol/chloroaromatic compound transport system permease small subunit